MNFKRLLIGAGVISATAFSYLVGRAVGRTEQLEYREKYPSKDEISAFNEEVLYVSSITETMYPSVFEDGMQPAGSPTEYAESAVVRWALDNGNIVPYADRDAEPDESYYKATGAVTISDTDSYDDMYTIAFESQDGMDFEAFGSIENFSPQVMSVVEGHGFHSVESVTGVFRPNHGESEEQAHFMCLVIE